MEDSLKLFQFLHAVELEMAWIKEHKPQAASVDYGNSYEAVQNLQKKHNVSIAYAEKHNGYIKFMHTCISMEITYVCITAKAILPFKFVYTFPV